MKKSLFALTLSSLLLVPTLATTKAHAIEGLSANVGVASQYFYRGVAQTTTASASAGVDYERGNFSVGTWAADVEDGIEVDLYASYGFEFDSGLGLSAGVTTYQYTGDFDSAYNEVNLGASFKFIEIAYSVGKHDGDTALGIIEADYDFLSITAEYEGFYATYGTWGKDLDGDYIELGYGTEVSGFDLSVALIANSSELDIETGDGDESLVFSVSKSF